MSLENPDLDDDRDDDDDLSFLKMYNHEFQDLSQFENLDTGELMDHDTALLKN